MAYQTENRFVEIEPRHYLRLFRVKWWFLLLMTLGFIAGGIVYLLWVTPTYQATTTILIDAQVGSSEQDLSALRASEVKAQTVSQLLVQRPVLQASIDKLNSNIGVGELRSRITVSPVPETQLIRITVEGPNPDMAAIFANTVATTFIAQNAELQSSNFTLLRQEIQNQMQAQEQIIQQTSDAIAKLEGSVDAVDITERNRLENLLAQYTQSLTLLLQSYQQIRLSEFESTSNIIQSEEAVTMPKPIWPNWELVIIVAGMLGFVLGAVIILIQDYLDDSIKSPEDIVNAVGLPVIGQIGNYDTKKHGLAAISQPRSPTAESFRNLRMNLKYLGVDQSLKTILITSSSESEGKSTFAANLAVVLAQGGQKTLLLDGDLRRPNVHKLFKLSNDRGFSDLFIKPTSRIEHALQYPQVANLSVITTGNLPPNPSALLDSKRAREIVAEAEQWSEMIIIDSPPLLPVTDALALSQYVDGVIMMVRVGTTKPASLKAAVERLQRVEANLVGIVMDDIDAKAAHYGSYYYTYDSYEPIPEPTQELIGLPPSAD